MAYPFEKMTTEKLNFYYEERVKSNSRDKDTNPCPKKSNWKQTQRYFSATADQATAGKKLLVP